MFDLPTPHGDKLRALSRNEKLPETDGPRLQEAIQRYEEWIRLLEGVRDSTDEVIVAFISLLNQYKLYIDIQFIFDSDDNFLYRQKGQLKLDNTILEEFLPLLVTAALGDELRGLDLSFGPTKSFSGLSFEEEIRSIAPGAGMRIRTKDQDFTISRKIFIRASHQSDFTEGLTGEANIAYVASEIKTNLDKTMFQEATATALDVKTIVPGAKYYLLCEWLDMTPISTTFTAIDEILILRRSKRLSSNIRASFSTPEGRRGNRELYISHLRNNPFSTEIFERFLDHIHQLLVSEVEDDVVPRGYF